MLNNGQTFGHDTVESILLLRDQEGVIWVMWYPALPSHTVQEWLQGIPGASVNLDYNGNRNWVEGVKGRVEMCDAIFRGVSQCCLGSKEMEADLWHQLRRMIVASNEGTTIISWGKHFNQAVQLTTEMPGVERVL